ncbi:putative arabinosyltransferase ARAD1 isoform X1 [Tasmannia lanceolata]|uniref:putative arabinosyltransferase ARAD1 isoform X1 n=1 Tax=Tasmannia lanceolata TaxID=3420 RepID=UPI00406357A5
MADRSAHSIGLLSRKSLFCFFMIMMLLFIFSSFFFLRSTGRPHFIDHLPNPRLFALIDNHVNLPSQAQNSVLRSTIDPSSFADKEDGSEEQEFKKCNPNEAVLKVFMYDLPPEFHFGLLDWKGEGTHVWPDLHSGFPDYPGGLNQQHSIEYWLTLDLLSSKFADRTSPSSAIRVDNSSEADVIFVPFFSSLSYNRYSKVKSLENPSKNMNQLLQEKLVAFLIEQEEWKRSEGRDHVIVAHHPNSMLDARTSLWPAILILADLGRYPPIIANIEKDVIAPYKHIVKTFVNDSSGYDSRPTLLYFQGAIYRKDGGFIRQELYYLLKDEKDVHFSFGSVSKNGINDASQGMHSSKFCLNIAGDTPSSNRLFDAIASHCVPVIVSDEIELPYEDVLDYSKFCIIVRTSDALKKGVLIKLIQSIGRDEWSRMWERLKEVERYFEFQYPSQKDDAVQMIWQVVARKVSAVRLKVHKFRRFARSDIGNEKKLKPIPEREKIATRLKVHKLRRLARSVKRSKKQLVPIPNGE